MRDISESHIWSKGHAEMLEFNEGAHWVAAIKTVTSYATEPRTHLSNRAGFGHVISFNAQDQCMASVQATADPKGMPKWWNSAIVLTESRSSKQPRSRPMHGISERHSWSEGHAEMLDVSYGPNWVAVIKTATPQAP
jgi:hypothetical protein